MNEKMNREKICKALSRLSETMEELSTLWEAVQFDDDNETDDILCELYPFKASFDELTMDVQTWAYNAIGKIENL